MRPFQPLTVCTALCAILPMMSSVSMAAPLTIGTPARIVAIGDSITEGKFTTGGYRQPLQDMLKAAGFTVTFVGKEDNGDPANDTGFSKGMANPNHEGYGSFRIDQMTNGGGAEGHSAPPIAATLATDKPDVILMMLGTNDLLQNRDLHGVLGRLDHLVDLIFAADKSVKLVLATPTPMARADRMPLAAVFSSAVPLIVEKYKALGDDITLADMNTALDPAADLGDGIHPTVIGYEKMANVWFQALTDITPKPILSAPKTADAASSDASPDTTVAPVGKQGAMSFVSAARDGAGGPFSLGYKFTTGPTDVQVTALGYLNDGASGDAAVHSVGLFDHATQQLITPAVTVTTAGGDLSGKDATFTYVKLDAPIKLTANTTYEIAGTTSRTGFLKGARGVSWADGIVPTSAVAAYAAGATLTFPLHTISNNGPANIGPNFQTAAP